MTERERERKVIFSFSHGDDQVEKEEGYDLGGAGEKEDEAVENKRETDRQTELKTETDKKTKKNIERQEESKQT